MGNWQLDPYHTQVEFSAKHLGMMTVRGHFAEISTKADIDPDHPETSSVEVTIQTASIRTHNQVRDNDLRSSNFLEVDKYPTITFKSTSVEQAGEDQYTLTGDLTIKGVTNEITIPFEFEGAATDPFGNQRVGFEGSVTINRRDYGVTWNAALEGGGVLVSDKVTLEFEISAIKNA
jgi:polyisoprenoid-binding protein YceI